MSIKIVNGITRPLSPEDLAQKASDEAAWAARSEDRVANRAQAERRSNYPDIEDRMEAIWDFIIAMEDGGMVLPAFTKLVKDKVVSVRSEFPADKAKKAHK